MTSSGFLGQTWAHWARRVAAIATGFAGGAVAYWLGTPLPWMLGPLFLTAALCLAGAPLRPMKEARNFGQVVVGSSIGLQFTQAILLKLLLLTPLIAATTLISTLIGAIGALMLMRLTTLDRATCFFATTSGGVVEMANIASRYNAELEPIAVVHTIRVAFIVTVAPLLLFHFSEGAGPAVRVAAVSWPLFSMLLVAAAAGGYLLWRLNTPNCWFLGAMIVAACVSMFGFAEGRAPDVLLIAAQVFMGTSLGTQFRREFLGRLLPIMLAGALVVVFTSSANALVGVGLAYALGLPIATMILATAPGGMAEMVVTAKLLGLDATLITGFQLLRIVLVLAWTDPAYRLLERFSGKRDQT
jgi:membrane AbrB-like protein